MEGNMSNSNRQKISSRKALTAESTLAPLAQMGGATTAFMRKFVRETIAVIEAGLWRDGAVKIHNFGTFRLATAANSSAPLVVFQPAKNIRELVIRAFGPAVQTGSRVSLPALLEKHLEIFAPPRPAEALEPPAAEKRPEAESGFEEFDIAEALPDLPEELPPRFTLAETVAEETEPAAAAAESPVRDLPSNGTAPKPVLGEPAEEAAPVVLPVDSKPGRLLKNPAVPSRKRRLAWYAGAVAALALLLLLLWPGRLAEKSERISGSAPPRPAARTGIINAPDKITNGHAPGTPESKAPAPPPPFFAGATHRVVREDNLWRISGNYYRSHYLWPHIYRANLDAIKNPDVLELEQQLAVPILQGPPEQLTSADRRDLAEGYFLLYRYYKTNDPALAPFALWAAVRYEPRIKSDHAAELSAEDWAFLQAHAGPQRQVAER
jgi:nucleoid-associated protein YgaU